MLVGRRLVLAGPGAFATAPRASAQGFPSQPIRLVVPFAPAGIRLQHAPYRGAALAAPEFRGLST